MSSPTVSGGQVARSAQAPPVEQAPLPVPSRDLPARQLPRWRRAFAEAVGSGLLVTAIVGSGAAASRLTPDDVGAQLAYHSIAVAIALAVLIAVFLPVSGAHLNPVVTVLAWWRERRAPGAAADAGCYLAAQFAGGSAGAVVANVMFELPTVALSSTARTGVGQWVGEVVATAGLVLVIGALSRTGRTGAIPLAVGGWIGAAIWFTASAAFANPAVTVGRVFTDSFAGIAPAAAPAFIAAQFGGALLGAALVRLWWPDRSSSRKERHVRT
ncbi:aquaporin [Natronosporangium hydrolyticum]|uniref:aquaporin n=1 Tax=Natronosporangium hydrolyticum TaxID=2811111 RepID=UPI001EFA2875|nr:aquaporin [Natronosporangium hydrolyticum]